VAAALLGRSTSADPAAFDTDGEVSAEQIVRTWELDTDLVVLSACESGLGKQAGGEGFLGFAQPLLARGARSLVLSLWKVDDRATSLPMARFYQNLLGKRPDDPRRLPGAGQVVPARLRAGHAAVGGRQVGHRQGVRPPAPV
jgi:hypothetical protein